MFWLKVRGKVQKAAEKGLQLDVTGERMRIYPIYLCGSYESGYNTRKLIKMSVSRRCNFYCMRRFLKFVSFIENILKI